jgi:acyl dehydratase
MQQPMAGFKHGREGSLAEDRYFEDYVPGTVCEFGEVRVTERDIVEFARRFDPQEMHVDPQIAARGAFGGLIASGWHTAAMMMRLVVDNFCRAGRASAPPASTSCAGCGRSGQAMCYASAS